MIAWDAKSRDKWAPHIDVASARISSCLLCDEKIDWSYYPEDWLKQSGAMSYSHTCRFCGCSCAYYLRQDQSDYQQLMALNCPQFFPALLFKRCPIGAEDGESPIVCRIAHTATLWLSKAVQQAASDHRYVEAFQTYSLVFESVLRCAWLFRGLENPSGTIGKLVGKAKGQKFISEEDANSFDDFITLRNDLTHGDWVEWPHYGGQSIGQEVEGRIWAWWFHEDGYMRSTRALYSTWPNE